jgi:tetratricopeptide (TPR) repeat protein
LSSIIKETEPGDSIIFLTANSYFEDVISKYNRGSISITWIVPDDRIVTQKKINGFKNYLEKKLKDRGSDDSQIDLVLKEGNIQGKIDGFMVEIIPVNKQNNSRIDKSKNSVIFADTSFPFYLYKNEVSTPMIRLLLSFGANLSDYVSHGIRVYIFDNDKSLPPKYRYFAKYLDEILKNPGLVGKDIPHNWWLRANAEYLESFFQLDEALQNYIEASEIMPNDPALYYQIAYLQAKTGKDGYFKNLKTAYELERSLFDGYIDIAFVLEKNNKINEALSLLKYAQKLDPNDQRPAQVIEQISTKK